MRRGLHEVVNLSYLTLFQWYELERLVCGNPDIDIEALRKHTTYRGGLSASHPLCRNLFRALTSFSNDERRLFLQFVWGRSRLPQHQVGPRTRWCLSRSVSRRPVVRWRH
jgi:hypothetical protein